MKHKIYINGKNLETYDMPNIQADSDAISHSYNGKPDVGPTEKRSHWQKKGVNGLVGKYNVILR